MRPLKAKQQGKDTIGVAIVGWNNEKILPQCLDSVLRQTYKNIKTIVLDNNSSDDSVTIIEKNYPWVNLIKSKVNTGFAKGNNLIVQEFMKDADIRYVVLLNSDASLDKLWVERLVQFADGKDNIAFLQGMTLDHYDHDVIDSTHIFINRKGQSIQSGHRLPRKLSPDTQKVFGVNAAACMITKDFLNRQPFETLFDEDFFMYLEDVDVAARSLALGWDNYFVKDALAYHMGSVSSGKNPGFSVYMVNHNRWPLLIKNMPIGIIMRIIPRMVAGDVQELYRIARAKNFIIIRKFIWGRVVGFFSLFGYMKKRRVIMKARKINSKDLWELMGTGLKTG